MSPQESAPRQLKKDEFRRNGYCALPHYQAYPPSRFPTPLTTFRRAYGNMPADSHLNPGEGIRFRRYARYLIQPETLTLSIFPHDRFFQSKDFDVLYGDIHREFPPLETELARHPFLLDTLKKDFQFFMAYQEDPPVEPYEISVHLIRIGTAPGNQIGRPAPEGIHRDGYHYASIHLMNRENVKGAENRIYDLKKNVIFRTVLESPMDSIFLDDRRVFHGVEPFLADNPELPAFRDMLILLYQPLSESPQKPAKSAPL